MPERIIYRKFYNKDGDLYRVGRTKKNGYFIETIQPAFNPRAGKTSRHFVTKSEAMNFEPPNPDIDCQIVNEFPE